MPQHRIQALHLPDTQNSQFTALLELTVYQPDGQLKRSIHGGREEGSKVRGYIYILMADSHCCIADPTEHCKAIVLQIKRKAYK